MCYILPSYEPRRTAKGFNRNFDSHVDYQCYGLGDHRLVQAESERHFLHVHSNNCHRLSRYLVLLERAKLGTHTRYFDIAALSLQFAALEPQRNRGTRHDRSRGHLGDFSPVLAQYSKR